MTASGKAGRVHPSRPCGGECRSVLLLLGFVHRPSLDSELLQVKQVSPLAAGSTPTGRHAMQRTVASPLLKARDRGLAPGSAKFRTLGFGERNILFWYLCGALSVILIICASWRHCIAALRTCQATFGFLAGGRISEDRTHRLPRPPRAVPQPSVAAAGTAPTTSPHGHAVKELPFRWF